MILNPDPNLSLGEYHAPLTDHEARIESNRCLYCYDAPCIQACPTHIDIPSFIKKISTGNVRGSARVILESNFLGGTCARVCPVQELCEGACVLGSEHKPIEIGRLQRYATDHVAQKGIDLFEAASPTGFKVAVVGSGPAGLSCAAELAKLGHAVTLFEKRALAGGLSTYGIIVLREPVEVALEEVRAVERLGVAVKTNVEVGRDIAFKDLQDGYDAIFLAVGLGGVPSMDIPNEAHILSGLEYIETSKLDPAALPKGKNVVVIGAGNTAIDAATVAKRWGAERVVMVYRRTEAEMTAYPFEYQFAKQEGIEYRFLTQPVGVVVEQGNVTGLECVRMALGSPDASGRPSPIPVENSEFVIAADLVIKAIGQEKPSLAAHLGLKTDKGYIAVDGDFKTSLENVYAGGDCIRARGDASTVMGVQDGKLAARAIHKRLLAIIKN
ncbi:MAG: NAD(P)-dependent oxidoreductase [Deinococcaceae bacterium]